MLRAVTRTVQAGRVEIAAALAQELQSNFSSVYEILREIESSGTARDEVTKSIRALRTYSRELPALEGRRPYGTVAVSLPFNNPLYSLILYAVGPAIGGSRVIVRPSSITGHIVDRLFSEYASLFELLGISLVLGSGQDFLKNVASSGSVQTLIFTGAYENMLGVRAMLPPSKGLVYCGSGINPFIVTKEAATGASAIAHVVDLAIRSKLYNSGQDCLCAERFYIHADVMEVFKGTLLTRLESVTTGGFEDDAAQVIPLLGSLADRASDLMDLARPSAVSHWGEPVRGQLVPPQVFELAAESDLMKIEKFAPIFTLAAYQSNDDLENYLDLPYRFGATVCGPYDSEMLASFPHVTSVTSVIESEAEDAHIPFGGRLRSGFSERGRVRRDGPILFSVETTQAI